MGCALAGCAVALTRIIHERFCCNRGFAAATSLRRSSFVKREASFLTRISYLVVRPFGGSDLKRDTKYASRDTVIFEIRFTWNVVLRDFATNRHE
jgi:hypothetical protein